MNRTLYILLLALTAALTAACSKDTPEPTQPGNLSDSYIFFQPEIMESVETRADNVPFTGDKFGVIGYVGTEPIFTGYNNNIAEVYKEESLYVYDQLAQWKDATSPHDFYAFYPFNQTIGTSNNVPYISYTQPTTLSGMIDIMTAKTSATKQDNGLVTLNFSHRLWALDVKVKNSQSKDVVTNPEGANVTTPANLYITDAKIHIYGFLKAGNIMVGSNSISDNTTTATATEVVTFNLFTASTAAPSINVASDHSFDPLLFLPVSNTFAYRLEIKFKNAWGASYDYYYPALVTDTEGNTIYGYQTLGTKTFDAGKRYTLQVEKVDATGSFNISWAVQNWTTVDVDHTFN